MYNPAMRRVHSPRRGHSTKVSTRLPIAHGYYTSWTRLPVLGFEGPQLLRHECRRWKGHACPVTAGHRWRKCEALQVLDKGENSREPPPTKDRQTGAGSSRLKIAACVIRGRSHSGGGWARAVGSWSPETWRLVQPCVPASSMQGGPGGQVPMTTLLREY